MKLFDEFDIIYRILIYNDIYTCYCLINIEVNLIEEKANCWRRINKKEKKKQKTLEIIINRNPTRRTITRTHARGSARKSAFSLAEGKCRSVPKRDGERRRSISNFVIIKLNGGFPADAIEREAHSRKARTRAAPVGHLFPLQSAPTSSRLFLSLLSFSFFFLRNIARTHCRARRIPRCERFPGTTMMIHDPGIPGRERKWRRQASSFVIVARVDDTHKVD